MIPPKQFQKRLAASSERATARAGLGGPIPARPTASLEWDRER